ncbi:HU family DNA-binding protein [Azomonas macrocytogenes]|uniref:DNA-binding protein HU-alpha n=1 Tax=Azomonas macrocytogenes TaxID=69962 RepID=A0A839T738_AZOMA|nr:DNA-binding protein HU-alpha [Azomonas macrocytogenes]
MRKSDLVTAMAAKADIPKDQANRVLSDILEQIAMAVGRKDHVTLVGFGTFLQRHRGARAGKNPQTGEPVIIGASNTVSFKPGKALREAIVQEQPEPKPVKSGNRTRSRRATGESHAQTP